MKCDHDKVVQLIEEGAWDPAHNMVQAYSDKRSCLLHGYLHRDEGDLGNAAYWYHKGGEELPRNSLSEELKRLKKMIKQG